MDNKQKKSDNSEFLARILQIVDGGISESGRNRFASIMEIIGEALQINANTIKESGKIDGFMCFMVEDAISKKIMAAWGTIHDDHDKDSFVLDICRRTDQKSYDAVITISEAWMAPVKRDESMDFRPSRSPHREEVVLTMVHLNVDFTPCLITVVQRIDIGKDGKELSDSDFSISMGEEIKGKMTGFEKQLCPIT